MIMFYFARPREEEEDDKEGVAAEEEGAPDTTTPLLPADDSGMGDCGPFPVRGVCLGFDTVDCVARPAATIALQYGTVYFLDNYDDSCTNFGRMMWVVLAARRRRVSRLFARSSASFATRTGRKEIVVSL